MKNRRNKGQSRGSEVGKDYKGGGNKGLFTAVGGKNHHGSDLHDSHEYILRNIPCSFVPCPPTLRLTVITVSLRHRHPPGGLDLFINVVLIVRSEAPVMS